MADFILPLDSDSVEDRDEEEEVHDADELRTPDSYTHVTSSGASLIANMQSHATSQQDQSSPPTSEICNEVHKHVFKTNPTFLETPQLEPSASILHKNDTSLSTPSRPSLALLSTHSQIHHEARVLFFAYTLFTIQHLSHTTFLSSQPHSSLILSIGLSLPILSDTFTDKCRRQVGQREPWRSLYKGEEVGGLEHGVGGLLER